MTPLGPPWRADVWTILEREGARNVARGGV
jgi:hypothetical protein